MLKNLRCIPRMSSKILNFDFFQDLAALGADPADDSLSRIVDLVDELESERMVKSFPRGPKRLLLFGIKWALDITF